MRSPVRKAGAPQAIGDTDWAKAAQRQSGATELRLAAPPQLLGPSTPAQQNVSPVTIVGHCVQKGVVHQEAVPFSPALRLTTNNQLAARGDLQACEERTGIQHSCLCSRGTSTHSVRLTGQVLWSSQR